MIGKSCGSTIILLAITVVLIGIVLTISQTATVKSPNVESFQTLDHTKKELKELNDMYRRVGCQRNIEFANHPDANNLSVAERAKRESSDFTCPTNLNVKAPDEDFYNVIENKMDYNLKAKCFNVTVTRLWQRTPSQVWITFPKSSFEILKTILYMNPIFVEFNKSTAYTPNLSNVRITFGEDIPPWQQEVTIEFNGITNNGTMRYSFNTHSIEGATPTDLRINTNLSCTVYYMELQNTSSEKIMVPYNGDSSQRVRTHIVFDKNYLITHKDKKNEGYYFHQKIEHLIINKLPPVITVKFSFNLTKNKPEFYNTWVYHEIFKMYMDTSYGKFNGLPYWEQNQYRMLTSSGETDPRNNMFSFWVMSTEWNNNNNLFELYVTLPSQHTDQNLWIHHERLNIWLPYCKSTESITVVATFTTTDIVVNARWKDPITGKKGESLTRRNRCNNENLYSAIFTNSRGNYDGSVNNIMLRYDNKFVTDVSSVMLGWRDFNNL